MKKKKMLILNFILALFKTVLNFHVFRITLALMIQLHPAVFTTKLTADLSEGPV